VEVDLRVDPFDTPWAQVRDAVRAAVDAGFAGIWTPDHVDGRVFGASQVLECWTTLTAIAVSTSDVKVGPLVLNVANHHPGVLASMAATLQDISGGRLLLGLGAGGGVGAGGGAGAPIRREQEAIGRPVPPDPVRRAQVETCVEEMRRLWNAPGFLQPDPAPPVVIAAFGPKMAHLAGRVGDGINTPAAHPRLREVVGIARDACAGAGRDPSRFLVTVFSELHERWLDADSPERAELASSGVDRLILYLGPPFDLAQRG
jgi:alkanesulfonate monooxygenase SsuD/methylene tetrahydromethanopterin reductase-like flavin-dependent oxidoreductase (luciferase family)